MVMSSPVRCSGEGVRVRGEKDREGEEGGWKAWRYVKSERRVEKCTHKRNMVIK